MFLYCVCILHKLDNKGGKNGLFCIFTGMSAGKRISGKPCHVIKLQYIDEMKLAKSRTGYHYRTWDITYLAVTAQLM